MSFLSSPFSLLCSFFSKRVLLFQFHPLTQTVDELDGCNLSSYRGTGFWENIDPDAGSQHVLTKHESNVFMLDEPEGGRTFGTSAKEKDRFYVFAHSLASQNSLTWEHNMGRRSRSHLHVGFSYFSFKKYQLFAFQGAREESQIPALCLAMVPPLRKLEEVKLTSGHANLFIRKVYDNSPLEWRIAYDGEETVDPPWDHLPFSSERKQERHRLLFEEA